MDLRGSLVEDDPTGQPVPYIQRSHADLADSIFEVDREGNFLIVPENLETITGFSREELELLSLRNIIFTEDQPIAMNAIESVFEGAPLTVQEVALFSEGRGSHPVELILLPRMAGDRVGSVWGAVIDIGDRAVLKERIESLTMGQDRLRGILRDFLDLMTREIRQPLTSILLSLELLESGQYGELPPKSKERIDKMIEMVERTKDILFDALEMSRSISGEFTLDRRTAPLREMVEDALTAREEEFNVKGLSIRRRFREGGMLVHADRKAIHQVIETLVDHSLLASPEGGEVAVELDRSGQSVQFAISDSGSGFRDEDLEELFDRFSVDPNKERDGLTSGLRFYLAKRIVNRHGGKIWCESFEGLGSTFFFTLPATEGDR